MIVLLSIFIFLLIFMSSSIDSTKKVVISNSVNDKYFLWKNGNKAFLLSKISISFQENSFSAFSKHADSIMTFYLSSDQVDSLKNSLSVNWNRIQKKINMCLISL